MPSTQSTLWLGTALAAVALAGCDRAEIEHYRVPHIESAAARSPGDASPQRMLGAIIPQGEQTWFLKLTGSPDVVGEQTEAFDAFVRSIRFGGARPIEWELPAGWIEQPASGMRYAAFRTRSERDAPELTVTRLGAEAAAILPNVNRWRGQLGLSPLTEPELTGATTRVELDGATATVVDMSGSGGAAAPAMRVPPFAAVEGRKTPAAPPPATRGRLDYQKPDGWEPLAGSDGMRLAGFQVEDGGLRAEITVVPLAGQAGGIGPNINRWRGQVGLDALAEDELQKEIRSIDVAGAPAPYADVVGPASAGEKRRRILGVIVTRGGQTWFFKMTGPAPLVGREKPAFEAFVRSVQFE